MILREARVSGKIAANISFLILPMLANVSNAISILSSSLKKNVAKALKRLYFS